MTPPPLRPEPLVPWDGDFPYLVLARFGLTPRSTAREVLDASLDMTPEDLADERVNGAWESLRTTRSRLLLDFFCPALPAEPPPAPRPAGAAPPLPWDYFQALAEAWPEVETAAGSVPPVELPAVLDGNVPLWEPGVSAPPEKGVP
jgi:hypothetical protein